MSKAKMTSYSLYEKNLPEAFDGFRIAHISDLHSRPADGIFEIIKENDPDIIVITGDLVHDDDKPFRQMLSLIALLSKLAPVYAVTGNHDMWHIGRNKILKTIESHGARFLRNEMTEIEKNGEKICLFGVDDPFSKIPERIEENVKSAIATLPKAEGFSVLLFHRANLFDIIKDSGFDLILSGHMHGGQIRLPVLGGVCAPTSAILSESMLFPKYTAGVYNCKDTSMIVNRGAGNTLPIPRFGNPPEVGIITLHKEKADTI